MNEEREKLPASGCSAPDLPGGYKERMDAAIIILMPEAKRILEICQEFASYDVVLTDGEVEVTISQNRQR